MVGQGPLLWGSLRQHMIIEPANTTGLLGAHISVGVDKETRTRLRGPHHLTEAAVVMGRF